MVEHVLIRIADLRDEASAEAWQAQHPCLSTCWRRARWLLIRLKLASRSVLALESTQHALVTAARLRGQGFRVVLAGTRLLGVRPPTACVVHLSNRELLRELEMRGIQHDALERQDLLRALCGPSAAAGDGAGRASGRDKVCDHV